LISFTSEVDFFSLDSQDRYAVWLNNVAKLHLKKIEELSITFLSDEALLEMNNSFLMHDEFTDILTFDLSIPGSKVIIGDIYISIDRVKDNSLTYGVDFKSELARVMVHGLLHLIGFNDKNEVDSDIMRIQEDKSLELLVL
jgi:rRNA maturation RNase YbeY